MSHVSTTPRHIGHAMATPSRLELEQCLQMQMCSHGTSSTVVGLTRQAPHLRFRCADAAASPAGRRAERDGHRAQRGSGSVFVTHPRRPAREQPVVHELDERAGRERAELGRVELEAGRLALPPPHLGIGAEDAIAEEVPHGVTCCIDPF